MSLRTRPTTTVAGLAAALLSLGAPALVAAPSSAAEEWAPYDQAALTLPADRYCDGFDLVVTPVEQRIETRVVSRYDDGQPRVQEYRGLLLADAVNDRTRATHRLNLSGHARVTFRPDGSFDTYEMEGPVGMGWPQDSAPGRGFFVMNGHHVVAFAPDGTRSMVLDDGVETNVCDLVD